jgi:hypothetical protein
MGINQLIKMRIVYWDDSDTVSKSVCCDCDLQKTFIFTIPVMRIQVQDGCSSSFPLLCNDD